MDMDSPPQEDSQASQSSVMTVTQEKRHEVLYFAYGSNMSTAQMRQRCPHSTPVGLGLLSGWAWIINERGYANVVVEDRAEAPGVYGLLYLLPPRDEERLDGYEGVPQAYEKVACEARRVRDGDLRAVDEPVTVLVYVDRQRVAESVPRHEYVGRMERAIGDAVGNWGLDEGYANRVMRRFWAK
ncbi:gamma-glutamyl cyclotransferase, AIG2-like domain-containing protein [Hirsutella rhossiliensis]|uniref:gamma-glutamylcyclotransferase n=1 Tax=Hirsutella rhossiliensis TaxID=111463 RepID=A0A9P8MWI3_9HYPO|nr:gamma-glutamyl cyclotransferase, AIG2-like domain-containing protein [Hirsutella rhossiliensis]KAH0963563.1 gamma-glutamyl cyclotransferase, AIG2-like domain-containing protein [Hirsutella rhossiliensis]